MTYIEILNRDLPNDEGNKAKVYRCTAGKLTIGIGRNLEDKGVRPDEVALMLKNDIADAEKDARAVFPGFDGLTDARKAVLCNMAFNLGREGLAKFKRMLAAMTVGNWNEAAVQMMDSAWSKQVQPSRSKRLEQMMKEG